jgi:flagellar basal body rod protein FlgG
VEESSVDEVGTIMKITSASRDAESNFGMIAQADRLNERVINTFGRVS